MTIGLVENRRNQLRMKPLKSQSCPFWANTGHSIRRFFTLLWRETLDCMNGNFTSLTWTSSHRSHMDTRARTVGGNWTSTEAESIERTDRKAGHP